MNDKPIAVLLSGGIDSLWMAEKHRKEGNLRGCIFVDYGHPAQQAEAWKVFAYCGKHGIELKVLHAFGLNLGALEGADGDSVMPHRNAILIAMAANIAQQWSVDVIGVGCNRDDWPDYRDCRLEYLNTLGAALGITVRCWDATKREIVQAARAAGMTQQEIWSCYQGGSEPCGTCNSCVQFNEAWGEL